jgi:hypothetical protein
MNLKVKELLVLLEGVVLSHLGNDHTKHPKIGEFWAKATGE